MASLPVRVLSRLAALGPDLRTLTVDEVRARRVDRVPAGLPGRRLLQAGAARLLGRRAQGATLHEATLPLDGRDLALRVHAPRLLPAGAPVVLHLHGGGFVVGSPEQYDWFCSHVALGVGCVVASLDYRKAPEHPAPAAVDDALAAAAALRDGVARDLGADGPMAVVGDSAGGNLAAFVALDRRDDPGLVAQWLVYPSIDMSRSFPSHARLADAPLLPATRIDQFVELYLADGLVATDPRVSPWFVTDLAGQAPALVQVAAQDPLVDEGTAWAGRLREAGVPTALTSYPGQPHGFQSLPGLVPAAHRSLDEGIAFLRGRLRP